MSDKLNILKKTLINADLNGIESELKNLTSLKNTVQDLMLAQTVDILFQCHTTQVSYQMQFHYLKILI